MELKVYISGKVTGEPDLPCFVKFEKMEQRLHKLGIRTVINPRKLGISVHWSWDDAMAVCMAVLKNNANCIVMLEDWKTSNGAKDEYEFASKHNYLIIHEHELEDILTKARAEFKWLDTSHYEFP